MTPPKRMGVADLLGIDDGSPSKSKILPGCIAGRED